MSHRIRDAYAPSNGLRLPVNIPDQVVSPSGTTPPLDRKAIEESFEKRAALARIEHERDLRASKTAAAQDFCRLNAELLESIRQLAVANADLEAFSYSVAHDLRSPIRQIAGFAKILVEEYGAQLPGEARRYLRKVEEGAQQMGCLVDDLLHLAQIGRQALVLQDSRLNSIVGSALDLLAPECAGRKVQWRIDPLGSAECDRGLMKQVFVNLLSNALKYTRGRDPAIIQVSQMNLVEEHVIVVRDNGVGFDMQYAGKLFGIFHRLHSASQFEGTGIGLATVERIIRKHGGRIWAQAEPGHGATFFFTVPPGAA